MKIRMLNEQQVLAGIDQIMPTVQRELTTSLDKGLESALEHSQRRVPERTGDLKSTGAVTKTKKVGDKLRAEIGYGGTAKSGRPVNYALEVHELPTSSGRKYLQSGLERADLPGELNRGMARALGLLR